MRSCGACFYGRIPYGEDDGECMNRPPVGFLSPDGAGIVWGRPPVSRSDWCFFFIHKADPSKGAPAPKGDQVNWKKEGGE